MKTFIYDRFNIFFIVFSILSLTAVSSFWWLSYLSIAFFIWNIFNERKYLPLSLIFFFITILLNVFNFKVLRPTERLSAEVQAKWDKTGYDEFGVPNAQEALNVITRSIEEYKIKNEFYPKEISEIQYITIYNYDLSYRVKQPDGQTMGVPFYYERLDSNKFFLAGVGKDGVIKTKDDLLPQISLGQEKNTGLIKYIVKSFSSEELEREKGVINMFKTGEKVQKILNDSSSSL